MSETDGSATRYSPATRAEIERRWQNLPIYPAGGTCSLTPEGLFEALHAHPSDLSGWLTHRGHFWLATHLHAQDDIQILLEGLATAERSMLAATARIAEVEALRREDANRYTDMVKRVGEANLGLRAIIGQERKESQIEAGRYAEAMHDTLVERDLARQKWAEEQEARKASAASHAEDLAAFRKASLLMASRSRALLRRLLESGLIPEGELLRAVREEVG